jgi:hypothetical protein
MYEEEITIVNLYAPSVGAYSIRLKNTDRPQHSDGGRLQYSSIKNS